MRKFFGPAIVAGAVLLGTTLPALADHVPPPARPHRHFVVTGQGERVEVGPRVCDNPALQAAFENFHHNVHVGAPGLQNGRGAEIAAGPC